MYLLSLSFDDGFEESNQKIAAIYERFGLSACFNVLALEEVDGEKVFDVYHDFPKGNFDLWNALQARGHEIMPHGLIHHNLANMPLANAQKSITLARRWSSDSVLFLMVATFCSRILKYNVRRHIQSFLWSIL